MESTSFFGIGGKVDLSEGKVINNETERLVNKYFDSSERFGASGLDAAAIGKAFFDWSKKAAEKYRKDSAEALKDRINTNSKWVDWKDL